jgi:hypothetical protein
MAIWPAQPNPTRARAGTGMIGTSLMRHDALRARAVPALRAKLVAQHGHEAIFSCHAGTRHGDGHDGPSVSCQPAARHHYCTSFKSKFHKDNRYNILKVKN